MKKKMYVRLALLLTLDRAFNEGRFECDDIVREMIMKGEI